MGEIIEIGKKGEKKIVKRIFDLAIVPESVYIDNPVCPHCHTLYDAKVIEVIEHHAPHRPSSQIIIGELLQCPDCVQFFLVMESPILNHPEPIMTKWSVPDVIRD